MVMVKHDCIRKEFELVGVLLWKRKEIYLNIADDVAALGTFCCVFVIV